MSAPKSRELPTDRLATTDQHGNRIYLFPAEVKGRFRTYRTWVHSFLILIFLLLPWVRVRGHQAVLLDIAQRRFAIFGITFWAHDAPMLVFIFGGAALTLGLGTAVWGREWCGWACPQTVFIDTLFRSIERWVEGDHVARRRLALEEWSFDKLAKKFAKWLLFSIVTLIVAHSFIAYFVGTDQLSRMIRHSPAENPLSFAVMLAITGAILFDFGWFREQFCTLLCPYGRFQSLLMDDNSLLVTYDVKRGEPRKGTEPESGPKGDCVNCYRCVQVCPTGIDIRRGAQLECIGCTACIDACDDVMSKTHKPPGLIRYDSEVGLQGIKPKVIRGRTVAYFLMIAGVLAGLITSLATRRPIEAAFVRATDSPYQEIKSAAQETEIVNRFKVDLSNQSFENEPLIFKTDSNSEKLGIKVITAQVPFLVKAGSKGSGDIFVKFPKHLLSNGKAMTRILIQRQGANVTSPFINEEITLVGPYL